MTPGERARIVPEPLVWIRGVIPEPTFVASSWGSMVTIEDLKKQLFLCKVARP